jgi:hypothetical protein
MTAAPEFDAPAAFADGVRLLRWPAEESTRASLAADAVPRILLVGPGAPPPEHWEDLEDWVRLPLDPDELRSRARTLRRRAQAITRPVFDEGGLLRAGDRWIDLPPGPRAVVEVLIERFGELVRTDDLAKVYLAQGGSEGESARKAMIVRLRRRLADLGLAIRSVRDSGYVLDWADDRDVTQPSDGRLVS